MWTLLTLQSYSAGGSQSWRKAAAASGSSNRNLFQAAYTQINHSTVLLLISFILKKKALQLFFKTFYILTISKKSEPTNTCLYNHPENRFHRHLFCWTINSRNPELISVLCRAEAIKPVAAAAGRCYTGHTPITMMAMRSRTITTSIPESTKRQKEA